MRPHGAGRTIVAAMANRLSMRGFLRRCAISTAVIACACGATTAAFGKRPMVQDRFDACPSAASVHATNVWGALQGFWFRAPHVYAPEVDSAGRIWPVTAQSVGIYGGFRLSSSAHGKGHTYFVDAARLCGPKVASQTWAFKLGFGHHSMAMGSGRMAYVVSAGDGWRLYGSR
jgi:hypothetical protein